MTWDTDMMQRLWVLDRHGVTIMGTTAKSYRNEFTA